MHIYAYFLIPAILLVGVVVGTIYFKSLSPIYRGFTIYLWLCLIFDFFNRLFGHVFENNLMLIPIFGLFEFTFFSVMYRYYLFDKNYRWISPFFCFVLFIMLYDTFYAFGLPIVEYQSYTRILDSLAILIYGFVFLFQLLSKNLRYAKTMLKVIATSIFYGAISLIVFLPINFLIKAESKNDVRLWVFSIHFVATSMFYIELILAIWKSGKTQQP